MDLARWRPALRKRRTDAAARALAMARRVRSLPTQDCEPGRASAQAAAPWAARRARVAPRPAAPARRAAKGRPRAGRFLARRLAPNAAQGRRSTGRRAADERSRPARSAAAYP